MVQIENNVFQDLKTGEKFRVILVDYSENQLYTISLDRNKDKEIPKAVNLAGFHKDLKNNRYVTDKDEFLDRLKAFDFTEEEIKNVDKEFNTLSRFWYNPDERKKFLTKKDRRKILKVLAGLLGCSVSTTLRKLGLLLKGGLSKLSLIPLNRFSPRGVQTDGRKVGRPTNNNYRITKKDIEYIHEAYQKYVLKEGLSFMTALYRMYEDHYSYVIETEKGPELKFKDPDKRPNYHQFLYYSKPIRDKYQENIAKYGENYVYNNDWVATGALRDGFEIRGPGSCYQIDATYLGFNLISKIDGESICSHPLVYMAIDVFTSLIVGFVIALEHESLNTTKLLYRAILMDKQEYCGYYGYIIDPGDWPCQDLPAKILADNGRAKVKNVNLINKAENVEFAHTQSYHARDKALVEHSHNIVKRYLEEHFICIDPKGLPQRGQKDPKDYASITLDELRVLLLKKIVQYNNSVQNNYPLSADMLKDGLVPTPVNLWNWGIENGLSQLKPVDDIRRESLVNKLLPLVDNGGRIVRRTGIQFNKFDYVVQSQDETYLYRNYLNQKIPVRYDPDDCNNLYADFGDQTLHLVLNEDHKSFAGLSVAEVKALRKSHREMTRDAQNQSDELRLNIEAEARKLAKESEKEQKRTRREKAVQKIRENNRREAEFEKQQEKQRVKAREKKKESKPKKPKKAQSFTGGWDSFSVIKNKM